VERLGLDANREVPDTTDHLAVQPDREGSVEGGLDGRQAPVVDVRVWNVVAPPEAPPGRDLGGGTQVCVQDVEEAVSRMGPGRKVPASVVRRIRWRGFARCWN
jgi:hypothetical protein